MLLKLSQAINQMNIWSVRRIQSEFQREADRLDQQPDTSKGEKCNLDQLLSQTDELFEKYKMAKLRDGRPFDSDDLNERIVKLEARIAEFEAEEEAAEKGLNTAESERIDNVSRLGLEETESQSQTQWIKDCMPRPRFTAEYSWQYERALVKYIVENPNAPANMPVLLSLQDRRISYLLMDFHLLVQTVANKSEKILERIQRIKKHIAKDIQDIVKKQEHEPDERYLLAFDLEILFLMLSIQEYTAEHSQKENRKEARKYLSYYLANSMWLEDINPTEALSFAKEGIALSNPGDRQDAFNILGLCSLKTKGGKQLAYDTYLSWIKKEPVGLLADFWCEGFSFNGWEDDWRNMNGNEDSVATMYNNFAYVCDSIAGTYELRSPERRRFQKIAINNIITAIEKDADPCYYWSYGLMLAEMNTPDKSSYESMKQYAKALDRSVLLKDRLPSMRLYCGAMIDDLMAMLMNSKQSFCQWSEQSGMQYYEELKKCFQEYKQMLGTAQGDSRVEETEKRNAWKSFFNAQRYLQASNDGQLELALLLIDRVTRILQKHLRRNAYSSKNYYTRDKRKDANVAVRRDPGRSIAYYTTIKTAMYLFNVLYRDSKDTAPIPIDPEHAEYDKGINCLTMMQAYYMNDPYEGLSFERGISGTDPSKNILFYRGDAWRFREDIFQKNFVFLKSFTHRMDNLLMWNRYGSDRESGSRDSNGCCIRFHPEFFDRVNDGETADNSRNLLVDKEDDYGLYRVVYLNQKGEIESAKNPNLDVNVKRCYTLLKQLLQYVNSRLYDFSEVDPDDRRIAIVRNFVQLALNPVIFLFKDDEYSDEEEYRLVVSRSHNEIDNIRMIPGEPEKACVNPYFQVCIDKVILGPNVENPEHWFNHFRYHIASMWRRALGPGVPIPRFTVEKSSIHYHT